MLDKTHHITLIDGSGITHRAWAMAPRRSRDLDGLEIGALNLFGLMIAKLVRQMAAGRRPPTHMGIFFDPPRENTWRRAACESYKANREDRDPEFAIQVGMMRRLCAKLGIAEATDDRFEADDLVASYARKAHAGGAFVSMISSDKDLMQLVRPGLVQHCPVRKQWFDVGAVEKKFGVKPEMMADFLSLAGDTADGIPGARGIGPKTAQKLIAGHGGVEEIIAAVDEIKPARVAGIIENGADDLMLALKLTRLDNIDPPAPLEIGDMIFPDSEKLDEDLRMWSQIEFEGLENEPTA